MFSTTTTSTPYEETIFIRFGFGLSAFLFAKGSSPYTSLEITPYTIPLASSFFLMLRTLLYNTT